MDSQFQPDERRDDYVQLGDGQRATMEQAFVDHVYGQRVTKIEVSKVPHPQAKEYAKQSRMPAEAFEMAEIAVTFDNNVIYICRVGGIIAKLDDGLSEALPLDPTYVRKQGE